MGFCRNAVKCAIRGSLKEAHECKIKPACCQQAAQAALDHFVYGERAGNFLRHTVEHLQMIGIGEQLLFAFTQQRDVLVIVAAPMTLPRKSRVGDSEADTSKAWPSLRMRRLSYRLMPRPCLTISRSSETSPWSSGGISRSTGWPTIS